MTPVVDPDFKQPLEEMRACHACQRRQLDNLEALVGQITQEGCDPRSRAAAASLLRDFDNKQGAHCQDEQKELFPMLRVRALEFGRPDLLTTLRELELEHQVIRAAYAPLRAQLGDLVEGRSERLDIEKVGRYAWLCRRHMRAEEDLAVPFADPVECRPTSSPETR